MRASWNKGKSNSKQWLIDRADFEGADCLIWPFSKTRGYGMFMVNQERFYAHRFMCELANGPPPSPEFQASHSCGRGNEGCVNPRHLSWKTQSDNQLDRRKHGTTNKSWGYTGRLDFNRVSEIRQSAQSKTYDDVAKEFGVSRRNVAAIVSGKTWTGPTSRERILTALRAGQPMTAAEVAAAVDFEKVARASTLLLRMTSDGEVERVERGLYKITPK